MRDTETFELKLTRRGQLFHLISALVCAASLLYAALSKDNQDVSIIQSVRMLATFVFGLFFWCGYRYGPGNIQLSREGITLNMNVAVGTILWSNFKSTDVIYPVEKASFFATLLRLFGLGSVVRQPHLGIAVADAQQFVASRSGRKDLRANLREAISMMTRLAYAINPVAADISTKLFGWKSLPRSGTELDLIAWNRTTYGYDIVVPLIGTLDTAEIVKRIQVWHQTAVDGSHPTELPAIRTKAPMGLYSEAA
ncbi:MAG: hypothetical protein JO366_08745 [Methylobacteriaceae bacterium]|nr:hypothetical protein [Methylobacteriaceae bacterium]